MAITGKPVLRILLVAASVSFSAHSALSQDQPSALRIARNQLSAAQSTSSVPSVGTIHGTVKSGNMPIPGAEVSISIESSSSPT
jgi:hypothetical protein